MQLLVCMCSDFAHDAHFFAVEDARSERRGTLGRVEDVGEVFGATGAGGGDDGMPTASDTKLTSSWSNPLP